MTGKISGVAAVDEDDKPTRLSTCRDVYLEIFTLI
jgi:hypothetical protein